MRFSRHNAQTYADIVIAPTRSGRTVAKVAEFIGARKEKRASAAERSLALIWRSWALARCVGRGGRQL